MTDPLAELARLIAQSDPFNLDTGGVPPRDPRAAPQRSDPGSERDTRSQSSRYSSGSGAPSGPANSPDPYRAPDVPFPPRPAPPGFGTPTRDFRDQRYVEPSHGEPSPYGSEPDVDDNRGYPPSPLHDPRFPQTRPFPEEGRGYDYSDPVDDRQDHFDAEERDPYDRYDPYESDEAEHGRVEGHYGTDSQLRPRRRGLLLVITVFGLAALGLTGAFAYRTVFRSAGPAPVIRADNAPNKVVPAAQNSDAASNKQYNDRFAERTQNERVVPREEQPVDIPQAGPRNIGSIGFPAIAPQPHTEVPIAPTPMMAAPTGQSAEARKIRTIRVRPDQDGDPASIGGGRPVAPVAGAASAPLALTPNIPASASATTAARAHNTTVAAARPESLATTSPAAPVAGGGWVVQVLAQDSEAQAQASFRLMQSKYPNQLGGVHPIIKRKEVNGGVKYGAQVGPYGSRDEAISLCNDLKAAGGACFVAKN